MTEYPSEAEIQTLIEQIDERPWSVDGYEFAGGSEESFTVTLTLDWVGGDAMSGTEMLEERADLNKIKSIVTALESEHDEGAPIETILDRAEAEGIDREIAEDAIDTFRRQGDVYEPTTDHLRLV